MSHRRRTQRNIRRNVSAVLAFALILSVVLPIFSGGSTLAAKKGGKATAGIYTVQTIPVVLYTDWTYTELLVPETEAVLPSAAQKPVEEPAQEPVKEEPLPAEKESVPVIEEPVQPDPEPIPENEPAPKNEPVPEIEPIIIDDPIPAEETAELSFSLSSERLNLARGDYNEEDESDSLDDLIRQMEVLLHEDQEDSGDQTQEAPADPGTIDGSEQETEPENETIPEEKPETSDPAQNEQSKPEEQPSAAAPAEVRYEMTLTGELPEGVTAKAYPVKADINGLSAICGYNIRLFLANGSRYKPINALTVEILAPELSYAVYGGRAMAAWGLETLTGEAVQAKALRINQADGTVQADVENLVFIMLTDAPSEQQDAAEGKLANDKQETQFTYFTVRFEPQGKDGKVPGCQDVTGKVAKNAPEGREVIEAVSFRHTEQYESVVVTMDSLPKHKDGQVYAIYGISSENELLDTAACTDVQPGDEVKLDLAWYRGVALVCIDERVENTTKTIQYNDLTTVTLSGMLPVGGSVTLTPMRAAYREGTLFNFALEVTDVYGEEYHSNTKAPIEVRISSKAITSALDNGKEILVETVQSEGGLKTVESTVNRSDELIFVLSNAAGQYVISAAEISTQSGMTIWALEEIGVYLTGKLPTGAIVQAIPVNVEIDGQRTLAAYDIRIFANQSQFDRGRTWQPAKEAVQVHFYSENFTAGDLSVYHMADPISEAEFVTTTTADENWVSFDAESFSVYVVTTVIEKTIEASDGSTYKITVTYDGTTGIPTDAALEVSEVAQDSADYIDYLYRSAAALGTDVSALVYNKLFDISIVDPDDPTVQYQPNPGTQVSVSIELLESDADMAGELQVVHIGETDRALDSKTEGTTVSFETDGFSLFDLSSLTLFDRIINAILGEETGTLYENDDIILSGRMPALGVVEANRVDVQVNGRDAIIAYDIKIYANSLMKLLGIAWQPTEGAIEVTYKSDALAGMGMLSVYHIPDGSAEAEFVQAVTVGEDNSITFDASSFSIYPVTGEDEYLRLTVEFYDRNSTTPIATMIVKKGDIPTEGDSTSEALFNQIVYDPSADLGAIPAGQAFKGWTTEEQYTASTTMMSIDDVRQDVIEALGNLHDPEDDLTVTLKYYSGVFKQYNVTYYGDPVIEGDEAFDTALGTAVAEVPVWADEDTPADYIVSMGYTVDDSHNFEGWKVHGNDSLANIVSPTGLTTDTVIENNTELQIKGDVELYAYAPAGHWLVFVENGKGGTYNAPRFIYSDDVTAKPVPDNQMLRYGYSFGGWYYFPEGVTIPDPDEHGVRDLSNALPFVFGDTIDKKTTIYAKWNPNTTAPYTVILWTQNQNRTGYEVKASYKTNGNVGQNIPYTFVDNGDEDYVTGVGNGNGHYTGFCLRPDSRNQQVTITPEGDAVLNLYYDRIEYNFKFYLYRDTGSGNNRYSYGDNSGNGSSLNDLVTWATNGNNHPTTTYGQLLSETHRFGNTNYTYYYFVLNAYYGEDISAKWPQYSQITGVGNRAPVSYVMMVGTKLKPVATNQGSGTVKGIITEMNDNILGATNDSNGNYVIIRFPTSYYNWRYHIWFETVEGEDYTGKTLHTYNGKTYYEETVQVVRSSNTTDANQNEPNYPGFDYVTRLGQNNNGTVWQGGHWTTTEGGTTLYHLNYIYNRQAFKISYFDGEYVDGNNNHLENRSTQPLYESEDISFGASIADGGDYTPDLPENHDGYVFEGWYIDAGCTTPATEETIWTTMPLGGVKVYAKWRQIQYRVFLHPNAGTDTSLNWGSESQAMNFRVSYGETVSTPTGTRTGYKFLGWYTDPELTNMFSDATELNENTVTAAYNKNTDMTDKMDKWGNLSGDSTHDGPWNSDLTGYNGGDRFWITKKFDLYAKWSKVLVGASGIYVQFDPANGNGIFLSSNKPYAENSLAPAAPAQTPQNPDAQVFDHWVLQTWNPSTGLFEDTDITLMPGETFNVQLKDARIAQGNDPVNPGTIVQPDADPSNPGSYLMNEDGSYQYSLTSQAYTYMVQLKAVYKDKEEQTPTHIYWYRNNGEEDPFWTDPTTGTLAINEAVDIQPAVADSYKPGFTFIGWARVIEDYTDEQNHMPHDGYVQDLTADDLFLKYENGQFYAEVDGTWTAVTQVAADERPEYQSLLAVWVRKQVEVTIVKVDEDGAALSGAGLAVSGDMPTGSATSGTSGTDGVAFTTNLYYGQQPDITQPAEPEIYTLTEPTVPSGYAGLPTAGVQLSVSENGVVTAPDGSSVTVTAKSSGGYTVTVMNTRPALTIEKTVTGPMADHNQEFTFTLTGSGANGTYSYQKYEAGNDTPIETSTVTIPNGTFTLKDGQRVVISNLPENASVTVTEATGLAYKASWSGDASSSNNAVTVTMDGNKAVTATNNFPLFSPTGVRQSVMPFIFIGLAGAMLAASFLVARRRRKGGDSV